MSQSLPMFPLNTVLFPGVSVPLHVFEDRYRALIHHLIRERDPAQRLFGSVGIREGYEVGEHGAQSLYRIGCRMQLTDHEPGDDGSFEIVAVGRDRIRLDALHTTGAFPVGEVTLLPTLLEPVGEELVAGALKVFDLYRETVAPWRELPSSDTLPRDPAYLSWALAALSPLSMPDRQGLLESDDAAERLSRVSALLRAEMSAMRAVPSLPATEVARTRWSPN